MEIKHLTHLPATITCREATESDRLPIMAFLSDMLSEYSLSIDIMNTDSDLRDTQVLYAGGYFGLLIFNNHIAGTFALYPLTHEIVEIRKMYLQPSLRGQGIGVDILHFLKTLAWDNGSRRIEIETFSAMHTAIHLYQRRGYREMEALGKGDRCDWRFYKSLPEDQAEFDN